MKKRISRLLALCLLLLIFTGCGGTASAGTNTGDTYTQLFVAQEAATGNMLYIQKLRGFIGEAVEGLKQENSLTLEAGGSYRLEKNLTCEGAEEFTLRYVFTGSYLREDDSLTLHPPTGVTADVDWGTLEGYFIGQSGSFTQWDSLAYPRAFNTPFLGDDNGSGEMYIQLDNADNTFEITGNQSEQDRYRIQELGTQRDGLAIYGNITLPAGYTEGTLPVVIFAHGFGGTNASQRDIAAMLAGYGIASYCFDFCGGALNGCRSEGSFYDMTMLTEKADLHAVVDMILEQDFTDPANVYLFGESMGGAVAALVAAERPDDIKGQLHFYPAFSVSEQTRLAYPSEDMIPERAPTASGIKVAGKFYADALKIDIYPEISAYEGPVLMFHGVVDTVVPLAYVEQSLEVLNDAELVVYIGEGHGFTRQTKLKAAAQMVQFILEHSGL